MSNLDFRRKVLVWIRGILYQMFLFEREIFPFASSELNDSFKNSFFVELFPSRLRFFHYLGKLYGIQNYRNV